MNYLLILSANVKTYRYDPDYPYNRLCMDCTNYGDHDHEVEIECAPNELLKNIEKQKDYFHSEMYSRYYDGYADEYSIKISVVQVLPLG